MSEKMHAKVTVNPEIPTSEEASVDPSASTNRGINWRTDVLAMLDAYAATLPNRSRSWAANELIRTHPRMIRFKKQRAA